MPAGCSFPVRSACIRTGGWGTTREQAEIIWGNIQAILKSADMRLTDIVKLTTYAVGSEHLRPLREVRERVLAGYLPASTLLVVAGLAQPAWLVEIEVYAARA